MIDHDGGTPTEYTYEVDGKVITAYYQDPYGFLYLKINKGTLPDKYRGAYTSTAEVEKAIKDYTNEVNQLKNKKD